MLNRFYVDCTEASQCPAWKYPYLVKCVYQNVIVQKIQWLGERIYNE